MKIVKVDVGWRIETDEKTYYVGEYCGSGVIYKDYDAFRTGNGVCYVPEYDFDNSEQNAGELFEFEAKEAVSEDITDNPYITTGGYTRKNFEEVVEGTTVDAEDLFNNVDWQSPATLLDEWDCE